MRREPDSYRMGNIFGQPAWEKAFTATTHRTASNVQNAFRQEARSFVLFTSSMILMTMASSFGTV